MFQNFNSRREEGDGVIAGALVTGFTRFLDWCCNGVFPDGGVIVVIECEVVKVGEVLWSQWVKVFELIRQDNSSRDHLPTDNPPKKWKNKKGKNLN